MMKAKLSLGLLLTVLSGTSAASIGDILLEEINQHRDDIAQSSDTEYGARLSNPDRLWPGGVVSYK